MSTNNVQITLTGRDAGAAAVLTNLTEKERQQIITATQLQVQLKQLELAEIRLTQARQARAASTAAAATVEERATLSAERAMARSVGLRHGAGYVLPQSTRQMMVQGGSGQAAREMIARGEDVLFQRWLLAERLRSERQANQTATNRIREDLWAESYRPRVTDRHRTLSRDLDGLFHEWNGTAGMVNTARVGFFAGGGALEGEDRLMTRARQTLARRLEKIPELAAKVTEEQFDHMSRQMADRMSRSIRHTGVGWGGVMAATAFLAATIGTISAVGEWDRGRRTQASERVTNLAPSRRELRQIATGYRDLQNMTVLSDRVRGEAGMNAVDANNAVFSARSTDVPDADLLRLSPLLKKINLQPDLAFRASQKIVANFGRVASTEQILGAFLRGAGPSPANVSELVEGVGTIAAPGKLIGLQWEDAVSMLGVLSGPNKNTEQTGERMKSLFMQLNKKAGNIEWGGMQRLGGKELIYAMPQLLAAGRLKTESGKTASDFGGFFGEQLAVAGLFDILNSRQMIDRVSGQIRGDLASGNSLLDRQAGLLDPLTDSEFVAKQAAERLATVQEKKMAPWHHLAKAIYDSNEAAALNAGDLSAWGGWGREKMFQIASSQTLGIGELNYVKQQVAANADALPDDLLRQFFINSFSSTPRGVLEGLSKNNKLFFKNDGTLSTEQKSTYNPSFGTATAQVGPRVEDGRALTAREMRVFRSAYADYQRNLDQGNLDSIYGGGAGSFDISPFEFAGGSIDTITRGIRQQVLSAYGIENDPTLSGIAGDIMNRQFGGRLRQASAMIFTDRENGVSRADQIMRDSLREFDPEYSEAKYKSDLALLDESIAGATRDSQSDNAFIRMRGQERLRGLTEMRDDALRDDGQIGVGEASSIAQQIKGQNQMVDTMKLIVGPLQQIATVLSAKSGGGIPVSQEPGFPGGAQ